VEHERRGPGVFQTTHRAQVVRHRRGADDERVLQAQSEPGGRKIHASPPSSFIALSVVIFTRLRATRRGGAKPPLGQGVTARGRLGKGRPPGFRGGGFNTPFAPPGGGAGTTPGELAGSSSILEDVRRTGSSRRKEPWPNP